MLAAAGLAGLLASGCGRNVSETLLVPTGMRPPRVNPPGSVTGYLHWAPNRFPDLVDPPYPRTIVELINSNKVVVARDTTGALDNNFYMAQVQPGTYMVRAHTLNYDTTAVSGVLVRERPVDVGDLSLPIDPSGFPGLLGIIGTFAGFEPDSFYYKQMNQSSTGIFTMDFPISLQPGTYRFKFVTDPSNPDNLIGWGADSTVVLDAPVNLALTTFNSGPAHDIKVRFAVGGDYDFVLDLRRQAFSIIPATAPAVAERRSR